MKQFDWQLFITLIVLIIFGEIAIYSASIQKFGEKYVTYDYYVKQLIWIFISGILFFVILKFPKILLDFITVPAYALSIFLLILVLLLPATKGVHRWIHLGGINIQPSEFAKLTTILMVARAISSKNLSHLKKIFYAFCVIIPPALLILKEPDLGSSLIFFVFALPMIYFAGVSLFTIFLLISPLFSILVGFSSIAWIIFDVILLIVLLYNRIALIHAAFILIANAFLSFLTPLFWNTLRSYQQERIITFLNPARDVLGGGYQIIQSKIAIGSGGIFGKGLLQGTQKNLGFLPEQQTDFIFSVVGEELGFFGCVLLLLAFLFLIYRGFAILKKNKEIKYRIIIAGILTFLVFQIVINVGMNIGILPVVGTPLPFISYGGSSLLINIIAIALLIKFEKERSFVYS
ncbi:MAG: rod shape-determining protein RodA [Candidatus Cloacimonadota bacterium]|nr:rod shape-determining protein RodA [Candidatus Cloacimonadota bacterium]